MHQTIEVILQTVMSGIMMTFFETKNVTLFLYFQIAVIPERKRPRELLWSADTEVQENCKVRMVVSDAETMTQISASELSMFATTDCRTKLQFVPIKTKTTAKETRKGLDGNSIHSIHWMVLSEVFGNVYASKVIFETSVEHCSLKANQLTIVVCQFLWGRQIIFD